MKIDKEKFMLAQARACMSMKDLEKAGISRGTLYKALKHDARPETVGKIARALGVDILDIIEDKHDEG